MLFLLFLLCLILFSVHDILSQVPLHVPDQEEVLDERGEQAEADGLQAVRDPCRARAQHGGAGDEGGCQACQAGRTGAGGIGCGQAG